MKIKKILIFGLSSNLTFDIIETCERNGLKYILINNLTEKSAIFEGARFVSNLSSRERNIPVIMGLVSPKSKIQLKYSADIHKIDNWVNLVDSTSITPNRFEIGVGVYINAGVVIGSGAQIGNFVTINRGASVGHHTIVYENSFIGPGAVICGRVIIEQSSFIGAGAVVKEGITIGRNAIVGAGAVVVNDVKENSVVKGNPARLENK